MQKELVSRLASVRAHLEVDTESPYQISLALPVVRDKGFDQPTEWCKIRGRDTSSSSAFASIDSPLKGSEMQLLSIGAAKAYPA